MQNIKIAILFIFFLATVLSYGQIIQEFYFSDTVEINRSNQLAWERIQANYQESISSQTPALPPETVFISPDKLSEEISAFTQVQVLDFPEKDKDLSNTYQFASKNHLLLKQEIDLQRKQQGILLPLANALKGWLENDEQVVVGMNRFVVDETREVNTLRVDPAIERQQVEKLAGGDASGRVSR